METTAVNTVPTNKNRIEWLDTLKFLGIYTIYIAHFLNGAGNIYKFACMYVIQLFFFVSGCFAVRTLQKQSLFQYGKNQIRHLLLPYFIYSMLNIVIIVIQENRGIREVLPLIKQMVFGIRNQLFAPALWFLPCLFVVSLLFGILWKFTRKAGIVLLISFVIYGLAANLLPFDATDTPRWFFNIDSALYYLFFFTLGAFSFDWLSHISIENWLSQYHKNKGMTLIISAVVGAMVLPVTVLTFFGRQDYFTIYPLFAKLPLIKWTYPIFIALIIIVFHIVLALWLQRIPLFHELGRHTLAFCGNETVMKTLIPCVLSLLGLSLQIATPLHAYVYAFILLILCNYVMIPIEKKLFPKGMIS
ncbi:MAG: acyltransferase family protein [Lachnospiraceae bacterium]|nr:acyltransferase family protein [Lachnospiraceae bacterium]